MTSCRVRLGDERGSALPLIVFYAALALAVVLVVAATTSLYLERKRLLSVADGAALAGAESFPLERMRAVADDVDTDYAGGGSRIAAELDSAEVDAAVRDYLRALPAEDAASISLDEATTPDGTSARVRLSSSWRPPVLTLLVPEGVRVEAESTARSVFH